MALLRICVLGAIGVFFGAVGLTHERAQAIELSSTEAVVKVLGVSNSRSLVMTVSAESFRVTPASGSAPLRVQFTVDIPGRFSLEFGDGQKMPVDTIISQPWVNHIYAAPGRFTATLRKSDGTVAGSIILAVSGR